MAIVTSRNSREFLERVNLVNLTLPRPRLAIESLLVNRLPVQPDDQNQTVLGDKEGTNPTDRGTSHPWPNQD
jgi:hypothetical protein